MAYEYVHFSQFYPDPIEQKTLPHAKDKPAKKFCKGFMTLDTETSHLEDKVGWIYQWSFSYPQKDGRVIVYGRKPSELAHALNRVWDVNQLDENTRLVCFVHNLSYDYTYFSQYINQEWGHEGDLLAVGPHKIISYNIDGLEFRDSLKIAQKSLDKWGKDLNIRHGKLVGEIDYSVIRYQDTPLGRRDWRYMFRDIISLDECIEKQLQIWNDEIWTMPLTNTGYVRRETRKEFKKKDMRAKNLKYFTDKALDSDTYEACRNEFAGGLTHGNRFFMNMTVDVKELREKYGRDDIIIKHRDFASHYPSQQMCGYCPSTRFIDYYDKFKQTQTMTMQDLLSLTKQGKCFLASMVISNLHIKDGVTCPVAQQCKFADGKLDKVKFISDNGRILHMEGKSLVTVNELDLKWLLKQYTFDYEIIRVYRATKGSFPGFIKNTVLRFFYEKSFYKAECKRLIEEGYSKDSPEYREMDLKLSIAKGMLNSIYGMTATDPVRVSFMEDYENGRWSKEGLTRDDIAEKLEKYYNGKNSFMNYELGLWTTALARNELLEFVELIGYENFLYADTDSIFYISTPEIEDKIEARNAAARAEDDKNGWYIEVNGKRVYFNQFEDENEVIMTFRFLHAKCYAYEFVNKKGELELTTTIAGVKEFGRSEVTRNKELGSIDSLTPGKVFTYCGGTTTKYPNGEKVNIKPHIEDLNGHKTEVSNFAIICDSIKELHSCMEDREDMTIWEVSTNGKD